jgi:hypothetical protein
VLDLYEQEILYMMTKKDLLKLEVKDKLMKQSDPSHKKQFPKRERSSLLKAIFKKLKREDVI